MKLLTALITSLIALTPIATLAEPLRSPIDFDAPSYQIATSCSVRLDTLIFNCNAYAVDRPDDNTMVLYYRNADHKVVKITAKQNGPLSSAIGCRVYGMHVTEITGAPFSISQGFTRTEGNCNELEGEGSMAASKGAGYSFESVGEDL